MSTNPRPQKRNTGSRRGRNTQPQTQGQSSGNTGQQTQPQSQSKPEQKDLEVDPKKQAAKLWTLMEEGHDRTERADRAKLVKIYPILSKLKVLSWNLHDLGQSTSSETMQETQSNCDKMMTMLKMPIREVTVQRSVPKITLSVTKQQQQRGRAKTKKTIIPYDIMIFQEINIVHPLVQQKIIQTLFDSGYNFHVYNHYDDRRGHEVIYDTFGHNVIIFYKQEWRVINEAHAIQECPSSVYFPHRLVGVTLRRGIQQVFVIGAHLFSGKHKQMTEAERSAIKKHQIECIMRLIDNHQPYGPVIVGADMNHQPRASIRYVLGHLTGSGKPLKGITVTREMPRGVLALDNIYSDCESEWAHPPAKKGGSNHYPIAAFITLPGLPTTEETESTHIQPSQPSAVAANNGNSNSNSNQQQLGTKAFIEPLDVYTDDRGFVSYYDMVHDNVDTLDGSQFQPYTVNYYEDAAVPLQLFVFGIIFCIALVLVSVICNICGYLAGHGAAKALEAIDDEQDHECETI